MITLQDIEDAQRTIFGRVHRTPLLSSAAAGRRIDADFYLKAELFQRTGSFKVRGVFNRLNKLSAEQRRTGVIGWSAGNHAAALAYAAGVEGIPCTVVMPETAVKSKVDASREYGAEIVQHGVGAQTYERMQELRAERNLTLIHPFDDPEVFAGAGTLGIELIEDLPDVDTVVVPIGGGGLIAGVATAVKSLRPRVRVIGVEPEGAPGVTRALEAGHVVRLEKTSTIADGLAAPFAGDNVLEHIRKYVDDVVIVTDDEIKDALKFILARSKVLLEPAGAAGVAALFTGRISPGKRVIAVGSGGNVDQSRLHDILA